MNRVEQARVLRESEVPHYNCCQSVLMPFAKELGWSHDMVVNLCQHFGGGMRVGDTCGAVTGALMALGLLGITDEEVPKALAERFDAQEGSLYCDELLSIGEAMGLEKRPHCNDLVCAAVVMVEELHQQWEENNKNFQETP